MCRKPGGGVHGSVTTYTGGFRGTFLARYRDKSINYLEDDCGKLM